VSNGLSCFKAYDIRGAVPDAFNPAMAYQIGIAYAAELAPASVVVGRDMRHESPAIAAALIEGLNAAGVNVIDIGLCGTEEVYFQTFHRDLDGGIMVTASHNPKGYNGMKLVREESRPISGETGLFAIRDRVSAMADTPDLNPERSGEYRVEPDKTAYIDHLLSYVDRHQLKPLRIVADPGNGAAGPVLKLLQPHLPFEMHLIHEEPDGDFPNGVPNPLLPEMREATARAVVDQQADFGIAWDGDFDRCFFLDADGRFIEGYYLVGLLGELMLHKQPGGTIIHDPRLSWNTIEQVKRAGGTPVMSKTGHAFIKDRMRAEDAIYGGEMSAHHYFRDFAYCDTGMVPWLLVAELIGRTGQSLASLVDERIMAYPCSGELNYTVEDSDTVTQRILDYYADDNPVIDRTAGLSLEFADWRFNLRTSNTEPLLRLNVEARASETTVKLRTAEIESLIHEPAHPTAQ